MIRTATIISLLFLTTLLCIPAYSQLADEDRDKPLPIGRLYDEAKFYYNQLQTNPNISASRDNWLKGTRNFRRIYLSNPKSEIAPSCLFMLGRIYGEMHERFQNGLDLDESIAYFKEITKLFPQHRLADDAFLALGQLYLDKKNNPKQAADYLSEIVTNYSNGDMHPDAENLLKVLSLEHDIALPKIMVSSSRDNKLSYVLPVKYWSSDNYTRVVIMASGPVNYKEILLEETENTPRRLYLDFKKSYIEPQYRAPVPIEDGLLKRIRTGQFSPDTVRVVLDIESIGSYKIYSLPDPFRVVIDVRGEKFSKDSPNPMSPTSTPTTAKTEKKPAKHIEAESTGDVVVLRDNKKVAVNMKPASEPAKIEALPNIKPLSLAQQLGLGVKKIVLDPGHGGKDPGAMAFGLKEKDIVLDIAKRLAPVLKKELGYEVVLTRKDDTFISLEERTALANTNNADLFISLHINAHPSAKVRGMETYYLNLTTNAEAMRVAARENATSTHQMSELQDILSDIMKNSKIDESSRLAQQVHNSILSEADKKGFAEIKNLGVKQAPFYVLIGAQMPAILIELAFISNEKDVDNLKNQTFLEMLTKEISEGIRAYVSDTTAQL
ncbi:MAG: AMIN domain-containing protein [Desulfobulbaceae bacterium]|nr:AMIN domain-containing protein [Desulfobulbaceae bacterium]